jgi:hypothetical protein
LFERIFDGAEVYAGKNALPVRFSHSTPRLAARHPSTKTSTPNETLQSANPFLSFVDQITPCAGPDEATEVKEAGGLLAGLCSSLIDWYRPPGVVTPEMAVAAKVAILDELGAL